jgi:uncharacterized protein (TIGR02266 family)
VEGLLLVSDRRSQDYRVKATFKVRYQTMDDLVVAYSGNLSRGGLFLSTDKLLPLGSVVRIQLELPDGGPEIQVPCRVAFLRDRAEAERSGAPSGMGVKFIDPDDLTRRRLEWFIVNSVPEPGQLVSPVAERTLDVVIVDDDPLQAQAAAEPFKKRGDVVRVARDGLEGLAACLKKRPDVLLSDVEMPRMDGWQFLRLVRARPALATVPMIFLTRLSSEEDRLLGYRLGVDDYINKPPDPSELVARAERAIMRAEQQRGSIVPPAPNSLRGDLEQVSVASILGFLEMEKKTGILRVGSETFGRIYLVDGRPVAVDVDGSASDSTARARLFQLLDAKRGRFEFTAEPVTRTDEIGMAATTLLLEHARTQDERRH